MVVHQTVKTCSPGFESGISPTCRDMLVPNWGVSRVGMITAGWPMRGGRGKKNTKIPKILQQGLQN